MNFPLDLLNFNLNTEEGKTKFYMTAQTELFSALSNLETTLPELSTIIHSIDVQLSDNEKLKNIDVILYKYILTWQTFHIYFQELIKIKNIPIEKYYQPSLYLK
jgi:hypothetical protein